MGHGTRRSLTFSTTTTTSKSPSTTTNKVVVVAPINTMLKQILESQNNTAKSIGDELKILHTKIDGNYNDLNNKFLQLSSHFKALENQFAFMPSTSKRPTGSLPRKSDFLYGTEFVSQAAIQIVDKTEHKTIERVKAQAELKVAAENLKRDEHKAENQVEREAVQRLKEVKLKGTTEVEQSPYDKLPFPQRVITKAQKKVISKFRKDMSVVGAKLPEISHMRDAHVQMMLIRDILAHKEEVAELLDISTMQLDPPVTPKSLPKLETQGKFTLSCSLGKFTLDDALVDSGASVNVISMEMVKSLGIENMEPNTSLHTKVDGSYNDLNNKFSNLASNFKALENQFASMTSTSKRPMGSLPMNSEQHPKEYCNAILSTTSEMELSDHRKEVNELERLMYGT
ncbi:hypothetical protein F2Q69_00005370 [Brassica cretica]|uniref:Aspartic peptidase DDI1-type domain-containing protein n=1 Tax=Brassica cretica TaxID=69181 RepID=A0A8S9P9T7_BRACR|nr:hypothetical protein F2Q69_00005370 [Brassica cretica]